MWSIWDVTEFKRTEAALRLNESRFRILAENTDASVFLIQNSKFCYVNQAAEALTGDTKGMELGADDYLTKPCTVEQLLRAIATRLEKQTQIRFWCAINSHKMSASLPTPKTSTEEPVEFNFPSVPQLKKVFDYIE
ncbi:MAG: PAS domain-containing protein [Tolypothrix brevis GSE-NOS-MK-07-07A]|nr:PAS domain-containing protein [Tolypothrix brevis GSE-NOS-MK-07-07A]